MNSLEKSGNKRKETVKMNEVLAWIMDNWSKIVEFVEKFFATLADAAK